MRYNLFLIVFLLILHCNFVQAQRKTPKDNVIVWASGGYSSIMNDASGLKVQGGKGISLGGGYEMHFNHFFLQTGLELSYYTSKMSIGDSLDITPMTDTENITYKGHFTFQNNYSVQSIINTGIPIMLGYQSNKGIYCLIGGKFIYNWIANSKTYSTVTSKAEYDNIIGDNNDGVISEMPNHGLKTENRIVKNSFKLDPSFTVSFEAGLPIFKQPNDNGSKNSTNLRFALFCDYGVLYFKNKDRTDNLIVNISKTSTYMPSINGFLFYNTKTNVLRSIFLGAKLTLVLGRKKYICRCETK